jgi:putative ABC transport system ATP-binding protein
MTTLYELKDVRRTFRRGPAEVRAVDGITVEIGAGELVAIEGPSGSGKTTLLQLLGGLERVSAGALTFDGREMAALDDKTLTGLRCREIGFVFQHFNLIPTLSAQQNVETAMAPLHPPTSERRARARELLAEVGLADRADHVPSNLSGGEQQRVAIARALANDPRVILADEPTGNLDTATSNEVIGLLARLSTDRGVTVVLVTHAEQVASAAHRRITMRDGQILDDVRREDFAPPAAGPDGEAPVRRRRRRPATPPEGETSA